MSDQVCFRVYGTIRQLCSGSLFDSFTFMSLDLKQTCVVSRGKSSGRKCAELSASVSVRIGVLVRTIAGMFTCVGTVVFFLIHIVCT